MQRVKTSFCSLPRLMALCSAVALVGSLAACAAPPAPVPVVPAEPVAPPPAPEPPPAPAAPPDLPPMSAQELQRFVQQTVVDLLEQGQEEQALAELQRVLRQDPNQKLANSLQKQITEDPATLLGRESFSYRVQPNETLSRIAGRYLNDIFKFYALARYNGIKVPRQVAGGQLIRVPGKAPPPVSSAPTPPPAPVSSTPATPPEPAPDTARLERERREQVAQFTRAARSAFAKQDLDGAIAAWERVLELDPAHDTARVERRKALELRDRLRNQPARGTP